MQNFSKKSFSQDKIVYISAGSNKGAREKNIICAFNLLKENFLSFETASIYETKPLYNTSQNDFLNTVFKGVLADNRTAFDILELLLKTENNMGRKRDPANPKGERNIDLDLLLFGDVVIQEQNLTLPHWGIKERLFVLVPLLELAPDLRDPITNKKYADFSKLLDQGIYMYRSVPIN